MTITPATPSDIPALTTLLGQLFTQEAEFTPDPTAQSRGLALIIGNPALGQILVARQGNSIVGMVNLLYTVSTALGAPVALLEDLIVDPAFRGAGIGGELLRAAIRQARLHGCQRLTVLTDHDNAGAHRLYTRHGFQGSAMVPLRLLLNPVTGC